MMLDIDVRRKSFPQHLALEGLRFTVSEGEFACLIGPSGCGKSTLLNIVNGLDTDFEGRIGIRGTVATMFQSPRLMPWLTVLDNVRLVMEDSPSAQDKARALLQTMELGDWLEAYPNRLSGGMQRRVALARAFAIEPAVLLMDEPFISLDAPVANRLRTMLIELWQERRLTVLFVTHDLREALALADRILFMSGSPGRVVLELPVDLPRPRGVDDPGVAQWHASLLREHPDLLAGLIQPTA